MSAPSKTYIIQLVQVQPEGRLAIASELKPAPGRVIYHREARGMGHWATTQVKGLSPEITIISVADVVHLCGRQNSHNRYWQGYASPTGSETVARCQMDGIGTRETHSVPEGVWVTKLEESKAIQMTLWESDKPIVVMKQSNVCGAKGFTGRPLEGDTTVSLRPGVQLSTKPNPMTCLTEDREVFLKSRVREICTHGSVRGFIMDSERRWL